MSSPIDLSLLPAPQVLETLDFETILASRKAAVLALLPEDEREAAANVLSLESEPATKLLQENAYQELLLRNRVNDAAMSVMLPFAIGADLDQIGANTNVKRLVLVEADPDASPPVAEVLEGDDAYRLRIQEAPDALSTAGPRNAYEFHARSADGRVLDARAISPAPCEVVVAVLANSDNWQAPADLLQAVDAALSAEDVRPLGDLVSVVQGQVTDYELEAVVYVEKGPEAPIALNAARANAAAMSKPLRPLGFSVYRNAYVAALKVEGVRNVFVKSPAADILCGRTQAARCTGIKITAEVLEEVDNV
ncbi:baseplate assembly protein [Herbaspirillum rubrisubalbicans]|uniref:baseplate assembly protein n=1 Tax=Herbaspirillum rubrisubalbicans TaxID=80842 RepID=UPI000DC375B5|nr:baseplate J/gp47 family protein [Herbaspirillum rubrisubalbicans]RAN42350.1 baseplate assembly protein [Herbaspirillum rubrisubalbicans]